MTKKRAIELLKDIQFCCGLDDCANAWDCDECAEALDMATEALKKDQKRETRPKMEQEILPKHCIVPPSDAVPSAEPNEDCISRKRLRESLKKELAIVNNNEMYWQGWHDCTVAVETRITDAPSVVPKHGEWIDVSERGSWATKNACDQCSEIVFQPNYNYCPNCGADMRGDKK